MLNIYSYDIYFYNNDFQTSATPISEGILHFHHNLMVLLTFFCFFVLWMLLRTLILFSSEKESNLILNRGIYFFNYFKNQSMILEIVWTLIPSTILMFVAIPSFALTTESYNHANSVINSNHTKVNFRNPLITIIKLSVHTSSNRIFLESNKNAPVNFKKPLISISKRGIKTSKKKKKSFINNVSKTNLINKTNEKIIPKFSNFTTIVLIFFGSILSFILLFVLKIFIKDFIDDFDWCDFFLETLQYNSTKYYNPPEYFDTRGINPNSELEYIKKCQIGIVDYALNSMLQNEFFFKFYPNTTSFQNYKIVYQEELKIFLEKLDLDRFENPDEALRFITAFYEHYFKIIEFNKDLIISKIAKK